MSDMQRGPWDSRLLPMTEETPETTPESTEGWTTTEVAAKALGVTPRTVKNYITSKRLVARRVKRGRARPYEVEIGSLKQLRNEQVASGVLTPAMTEEEIEAAKGGYEEIEQGEASPIVELARDLVAATERAARAEERAELTERAESSLREEVERLRSSLSAQDGQVARLTAQLQDERRKPWWRKLFNG